MERAQIPVFAEVLELYYTHDEIEEMASIFDVSLPLEVIWKGGTFNWLGAARHLVEKLDHGNNRTMMESLLSALEQRNKTAIARTDWERRDAHQNATPKIEHLVIALSKSGIPREIAVEEKKPFSAKSEVREFLEQATTPILLIDPYIGVGTLDCLRNVQSPIRLLTGTHPSSIENGFEESLRAFQLEGFQIEVKQHDKLHDRHLCFNERCWLVGSSLKDAGKKSFHVMEIVDAKTEVLAALETKWNVGSLFPRVKAAVRAAEEV